MKKTYPSKSSFQKLYLIEEEMYNRIIPKLNEVDKQELNYLNESNKSYHDSNDDDDDNDTRKENNNDDTRKQKNELTNSVNNQPLPSKKRKEKKYPCEICINKKFTTKSSLKRHHKTFHEEKQFIKQSYEPGNIITPTINTPDKQINLKRKFSNDYDSLNEEPIQKSLKISKQQEQRGIKRKGPKRSSDYLPRKKIHWSSNDSTEEPIQQQEEEQEQKGIKRKGPEEEEEQEEQQQKGIKRKGPKRASDYLPRKKFHWASF